MRPSEIRTELMAQHADLRVKITAVRAAIGQAPRGGGPDLFGALARLADALRIHNAREEELMRDVLPTLDAWGSIRAEMLEESHIVEHEEIVASLITVGDLGNASPPAMVLAALDQLVLHMDREEKLILAEDLLKDGGPTPDYFGG